MKVSISWPVAWMRRPIGRSQKFMKTDAKRLFPSLKTCAHVIALGQVRRLDGRLRLDGDPRQDLLQFRLSSFLPIHKSEAVGVDQLPFTEQDILVQGQDIL